jgi:hypothetical protein
VLANVTITKRGFPFQAARVFIIGESLHVRLKPNASARNSREENGTSIDKLPASIIILPVCICAAFDSLSRELNVKLYLVSLPKVFGRLTEVHSVCQGCQGSHNE